MAPFKPYFNALFRSGASSKEIDLGMDIDELKKIDKKFFDKGFRMSFLYVGEDSYQAAWEHGSGAQHWLVTDDFDELKSEEKKQAEKGLRFKYLHAEAGNISAIWHPGSGQQFWRVNISFNDFKAEDEKMKSQGLILMRMCDDGGKYSGFWQPGTKEYSWISTSDLDQFNEFTKTNAEKGRLAVSFGGPNLCAVFHEGTGEQRWAIRLKEKEFAKRAEELVKDNFHIIDLYITYGN